MKMSGECLIQQSESFTPSAEEMVKLKAKLDPTVHGTTGPLQRTLPKWVSNIQDPLIQGMESLGVPFSLDSVTLCNQFIFRSIHLNPYPRPLAIMSVYGPVTIQSMVKGHAVPPLQ